ncbi:hypothetical protein CBS101457_001704 [Exobasidium rhododendri]|nr:hypothetical protein CBS101457_001704 [Exobasidium rhododendri]
MASSSVISGPIPPPRSLPLTQPQPASSSLAFKYRGATVEDLQLSPAVCIPTSATIGSALQVAFDHDYEQLPVLSTSNGNRKLLGYLDIRKLRGELEAGKLNKNEGVMGNMVKFGGKDSVEAKDKTTYTLISPETGLGELEAFLTTYPFALVTDASRSFVLAVATREDLTKYAQRRGLEETGEQPPLSRREEEEKRKDRSLAEFLGMLDGYRPLIPDEVTDHYLEKVGFECEDPRLKRLFSLAAEKFAADIAADAFQYARIRTTGAKVKASAGASNSTAAAVAAANVNSAGKDRSRTVLTMDDLSAALSEHGVQSLRADFYR